MYRSLHNTVKQRITNPKLRISPRVATALADGAPVVALESTVISHGMPWPQNLRVAQELEDTVRAGGAEPATIACLQGNIVVGCEPEQLELLASTGTAARKVSTRDFPWVLSDPAAVGATTVAGTCVAAAAAGIQVFATGGLGGVHRGGELSMDVSADLIELSRQPVAVVCAGVKSLLDIPRTLEVLETFGVPVTTLQHDKFPCFFVPDSGVASPHTSASTAAVAAAIHAQASAQLAGGMLVAVPPPDHPAAQQAADAIRTAVRECEEAGIQGKDITPWILARTAELTGGASVEANIELIKHNAKVATEIAVELSSRNRETRG